MRLKMNLPLKTTLSAVFLGLIALAEVGGCVKNQKQALTLAGSTSVQPFAEKWAEAFRKKRPELDIRVQGGGSTAGVQSAISGAAHIGTCSRDLKGDEAAKVKGIVVARDGIAVIVHKDSPISDLTVDQVQKIYAGEIASWKDVGGPDAKITVITREEGSGTRGAFEELLMKDKKIAGTALVQDSTGAVRQMVSSDTGSIGYISLGLIDASVKPLKLGGIEATEAQIDAGKYPLVRPFLFVVKDQPAGTVKEFIDWITGPEGQALTRKEGLLPPKS
jgi:phosphate transport system substrate-binding protein